jgi:hypothetical protein
MIGKLLKINEKYAIIHIYLWRSLKLAFAINWSFGCVNKNSQRHPVT